MGIIVGVASLAIAVEIFIGVRVLIKQQTGSHTEGGASINGALNRQSDRASGAVTELNTERERERERLDVKPTVGKAPSTVDPRTRPAAADDNKAALHADERRPAKKNAERMDPPGTQQYVVRNLAHALRTAGFTVDFRACPYSLLQPAYGVWRRNDPIAAYIRYGSAEVFKSARRSDIAEAKAAPLTREHRETVRQVAWRVGPLEVNAEIGNHGTGYEAGHVNLTMLIPVRLMPSEGFRHVGVSYHTWGSRAFLTKDMTLQQCSVREARTAENNNGLVYYPDSGASRVVVQYVDAATLPDDEARLRAYVVVIQLHEEQIARVGYYCRNAYLAMGYDESRMLRQYQYGFNGPENAPFFFCVKEHPTDIMVTSGTLVSLQIRDGDKVVYSANDSSVVLVEGGD